MLNVPESIKRLYQTDGINKNFRVHFPNGENVDLTNKDIVDGSVKFAESVSSKDVLKFGLSEQSKIEFECVGVQNIFGMTIECSNEIDISSLTSAEIQEIQDGEWDGTLVLAGDSDIDYGYFRIPLGTFVVSSCPRSHGAMAHRRVTAFTRAMDELTKGYNEMFNGVFPFESIKIDYYILEAILGNEPMRGDDADSSSGSIGEFLISPTILKNESSRWMQATKFYNASKAEYVITVEGYTKSIIIPNGDYCEIDYTGDKTLYMANAEKIVKAIDDDGWDILCNKDGKKIYESTESALKARAPWLFYPALSETIMSKPVDATSNKEIWLGDACEAKKGLNLTPLNYYELASPRYYDDTVRGIVGEGLAISEDTTGYSIHKNKCVNFYYPYSVDRLSTIKISLYRVSKNPADITLVKTLDVEFVDYRFNVTKVKGYKIPTDKRRTGKFIKINSSLKTNAYTYVNPNDLEALPTGEMVSKKYKSSVFQNSISIGSLVEGFSEICGSFDKVSRTGGTDIVTLSKSNPISIEPSDVGELWWDEYDVEQIGTVRYNIADTQSIVEYQIGNGGSVYDFGDNYFIKRIFASYTEDNYADAISLINSLIDQYFVPNVTDVPFVPVDMTMRGLPYVESGDYIVYDDGIDQVGTYVLNREMDGVQSLFDDIESNGGEVMGK